MGVKFINLYNRGDECIDITGGWYIQRYSGKSTPTLTKLSDRMEIKAPKWSANHLYMRNGALPAYGTVFVEYSISDGYDSYAGITGIMSSGNIIHSSPAVIKSESTSEGIDISNLDNAVLTIYRICVMQNEQTVDSGLASVTQEELLARRVAIIKNKLWLYRDGDECVNVTGGWEGLAIALTSSTWGQTPSITRNQNTMFIAQYVGGGIVKTKNKIPLSTYRTLHADITVKRLGGNDADGYQQLVLWKSIGNISTVNTIATKELGKWGRAVTYNDISLSFNTQEGDAFIGFSLYNTPQITVRRIWLE